MVEAHEGSSDSVKSGVDSSLDTKELEEITFPDFEAYSAMKEHEDTYRSAKEKAWLHQGEASWPDNRAGAPKKLPLVPNSELDQGRTVDQPPIEHS